MSTKTELKCRDDWRSFGDRFGWRLYGWTGLYMASFVLPSGGIFEVSAEARRTIEEAMTRNKGGQG